MRASLRDVKEGSTFNGYALMKETDTEIQGEEGGKGIILAEDIVKHDKNRRRYTSGKKETKQRIGFNI